MVEDSSAVLQSQLSFKGDHVAFEPALLDNTQLISETNRLFASDMGDVCGLNMSS